MRLNALSVGLRLVCRKTKPISSPRKEIRTGSTEKKMGNKNSIVLCKRGSKCFLRGFIVCRRVGVLRVVKSVLRVVKSVILRYGFKRARFVWL